MQEDQRLGQLAPFACGLPAESYDGVLVHRLIDVGWRLEHVQDKCLYDHSPSPQVRQCSRSSCPGLLCALVLLNTTCLAYIGYRNICFTHK